MFLAGRLSTQQWSFLKIADINGKVRQEELFKKFIFFTQPY
jgi:hypothetical protein